MNRLDYENLPGPLAWCLFERDCAKAPLGVAAAALLYGIERGWARGDKDDDWRDIDWTGPENAEEILTCRGAFAALVIGYQCADEAEAMVVFTALRSVPAAWKKRADEELTLLAREWPAVQEAQRRRLTEAEEPTQ